MYVFAGGGNEGVPGKVGKGQIFRTHLGKCYTSFDRFFFLNLLLATLGLRCCTHTFSSCGKRGLLFVAVRGLLTAVTSLVVEHGL